MRNISRQLTRDPIHFTAKKSSCVTLLFSLRYRCRFGKYTERRIVNYTVDTFNISNHIIVENANNIPTSIFCHLSKELTSKKTLLFGEHDLERDVEEHVAEFGAQVVLVTSCNRVIEFEDLLHEVGPQTLWSLSCVPRAPCSEVPDQVDDAPKR